MYELKFVFHTKEKFDWMSKPEFHSFYKRHMVRSEVTEEVETGQRLDSFAKRSLETKMFLVLNKTTCWLKSLN